MQKTFYFVDGVQPNKTSQKLMRRHVMKGKNAGKKIHRPSRLGLRAKAIDARDSNRENRPVGPHLPCNTVDRSFGHAILAASLPTVEITPASLETINQFFDLTTDRLCPVKLGISLDEVKYSWFQMLFTDEAAYHCNLGLMQACNGIFLSDGNSPARALYHLSQTFLRVQARLESDDALSDSTLGLVISLVLQEQIRNQLPAAQVHGRGLQRMIQLRGGLTQLEGNVGLVLRACKADIMLALQHGGPTMFFRDRMHEVWNIIASKGYDIDHIPAANPVPGESMDPHLLAIFSDAKKVCWLVNHNPDHPVLDYLVFEEVFVSLCYRLLRFGSLNDLRTQPDSQTTCYLGLLMFIMTTFFQINRNRILEFALLSLCFRDFIDNKLHQPRDGSALWVLIVSGIWNPGDVNFDQIASQIRQFVQQRGMDSWDHVQRYLCHFPWIQALHDEPGHNLWNRVLYTT